MTASARAVASTAPVPGSRIATSSPPTRPHISPAWSDVRSVSAIERRYASPARRPCVSFSVLKLSRPRMMSARGRAKRSARAISRSSSKWNCSRFAKPVRASAGSAAVSASAREPAAPVTSRAAAMNPPSPACGAKHVETQYARSATSTPAGSRTSKFLTPARRARREEAFAALGVGPERPGGVGSALERPRARHAFGERDDVREEHAPLAVEENGGVGRVDEQGRGPPDHAGGLATPSRSLIGCVSVCDFGFCKNFLSGGFGTRLSPQSRQGVTREPVSPPVVHGNGAERPVKADRRLVPRQDAPLHAAAARARRRSRPAARGAPCRRRGPGARASRRDPRGRGRAASARSSSCGKRVRTRRPRRRPPRRSPRAYGFGPNRCRSSIAGSAWQSSGWRSYRARSSMRATIAGTSSRLASRRMNALSFMSPPVCAGSAVRLPRMLRGRC